MAQEYFAGLKRCKACREYIDEKASKCPECMSEQSFLYYLGQKLFSIIGILAVAVGFAFTVKQLEIAQQQIEESGRLTWVSGLDTRSFELAKLAIDKPELGCIYQSNMPSLNEECSRILEDNQYLLSSMEYTEVLLDHLLKIAMYSEEEDIDQYDRWYSRWAADLAEDPHGIIRYTILNSLRCGEDCVNLAKRLLICSKNAANQECRDWLERGSADFQAKLEK
jgi:hypothetical protein